MSENELPEDFEIPRIMNQKSTFNTPPNILTNLALVVGNGPSAKLLDFTLLRRGYIATVGMNAAYRYWDRIDFRPTYYICMDTVVILSHAKRIYELVNEGRITKFFLRDEIKGKFPELDECSNILWFDDVRKRKVPVFDTNLITTGSFAIRWMAFEGYKTLSTIGIDARYVELLSESERLGSDSDLRLSITKTPNYNPNYFFSDYQQQGDVYNVPNSPDYKEQTGKLVHIEALRRTCEDFEKQNLDIKVFDSSPISNHGVFKKRELEALLQEVSFPLVTSFFTKAPEDELKNNIRIAIKNARNPLIATVSIFLEGPRSQLETKIGQKLSIALSLLESTGNVMIIHIDQRPDYHSLFGHARNLAAKCYMVANSDIEITDETAAKLLADRLAGVSGLFALTRWNVTKRGRFIQSISSQPPWAEIEFSDIKYSERNYLTFDSYFVEASTPLPIYLKDILIGTFGCDTAICAIFRAYGVLVSNPCLLYQTSHYDEKVRDYSSDTGAEQMRQNGEVLRQLLLDRYRDRPLLCSSLISLPETRIEYISFGRPHHFGVWQMLFRLLGSAPWVDAPATAPIVFKRFEVEFPQTSDQESAFAEEVISAIDAAHFLEIELKGHVLTNKDHWLANFSRSPILQDIKQRLYRYDWVSVIHEDTTDLEKRVHSDVLLIIKNLLGLNSSEGATGLGHIRRQQTKIDYDGYDRNPDALQEEKTQDFAKWRNLKVLVIDSTPIGSQSATGQIKRAFFEGWDSSLVIQIGLAKGNLVLVNSMSSVAPSPNSINDLLALCKDHNPDVIYCRPIDSIELLDFTNLAIDELNCATVVHMMDDWPKRIEAEDPAKHQGVDSTLRSILHKADLALSICPEMSAEYLIRYGRKFEPIANGVDLEKFSEKDWLNRPSISKANPFNLLYMGGLAEDMTANSVFDIARIVTEISGEYPIKFTIYTMPWYIDEARSQLDSPSVQVLDLVDFEEYPAILRSSDCLLIAYNFDERSIRYTSLSFANKLPEIMAVGVPILGYGPARLPTISFLNGRDFAHVVIEQSDETVKALLIGLVNEPERCREMGLSARVTAKDSFNIERSRALFRSYMETAVNKHCGLESSTILVEKSFSEANRLFRNGDYEAAHQIYLSLYRRNPLAIYQSNLEMNARHLRVKSVENNDQTGTCQPHMDSHFKDNVDFV